MKILTKRKSNKFFNQKWYEIITYYILGIAVLIEEKPKKYSEIW
jgi:hypothetical protein